MHLSLLSGIEAMAVTYNQFRREANKLRLTFFYLFKCEELNPPYTGSFNSQFPILKDYQTLKNR